MSEADGTASARMSATKHLFAATDKESNDGAGTKTPRRQSAIPEPPPTSPSTVRRSSVKVGEQAPGFLPPAPSRPAPQPLPNRPRPPPVPRRASTTLAAAEDEPGDSGDGRRRQSSLSKRDDKFYSSFSTTTPAALMSAKRKSSVPRKAGPTAAAIDNARRESADFLRAQEEADRAVAATPNALRGGSEVSNRDSRLVRINSAYVDTEEMFGGGGGSHHPSFDNPLLSKEQGEQQKRSLATNVLVSGGSMMGAGKPAQAGGGGGDDSAALALALQEEALAQDIHEAAERVNNEAVREEEDEDDEGGGEEEDGVADGEKGGGKEEGACGGGSGGKDFASTLAGSSALSAAAAATTTSAAAAKTSDGVLKAKKRERKRMSLIISAGASTEVVLEVFAELGNSIARLRTTLVTAVASMPANSRGSSAFSRVSGGGGGGVGGLLLGALGGGGGGGASPGSGAHRRDYTKALSRISAGLQTSLQVLDAIRSVEEPRAEVVALASLAGGGGGGGRSLFLQGGGGSPDGGSPHSSGSGGSSNVLFAGAAKSSPNSPKSPSSAAVDVNGGYTGGVVGGVGGGSAWYHYARRFKFDLESCRDQLIEVALLVVDLNGATSSLEATSLVDKMVERMSLRVADLAKSVEKGEASEVKRREAKESALHDLVDDRKAEAENERQQMLHEVGIISKKCHRSGNLDKLPIVKRRGGGPASAGDDDGTDERAASGGRGESGGRSSPAKSPRISAKKSPASGGGGEASSPASGGSTTVGGSSVDTISSASAPWRRRFMFLDYKSLTYTHKATAASNNGGSGGDNAAEKPSDQTSTSLELDHTTSAFVHDPLAQPGVFTLTHGTYELSLRAESAQSAQSWVAAILLCAQVHSSRNERERTWFVDKASEQWWGDMVVQQQQQPLSVPGWVRLFASVVAHTPQAAQHKEDKKDAGSNGSSVNGGGGGSVGVGAFAGRAARAASHALVRRDRTSSQLDSSSHHGSSSSYEDQNRSTPAAVKAQDDALALKESFGLVEGAVSGVEGLGGRVGHRLKGHLDRVTCLGWSKDGKHVVSGSKEARVLVWAVPAASAPCTHDTKDSTTSTAKDLSHDDKAGELAGTKIAADAAHAAADAASATMSAAASAASDAKNLLALKPCEELNMGSGNNWALACTFSPTGRFVAVAGLNQKIAVGDWRFQRGRSYALHQVGNGDEHLGSVTALCYLGQEDGLLASGCSDSYLRIWDVESMKMIARLSAQEDEVQCLAAHEFSPAVVVSGGADCCARVHDIRQTKRSCVAVLRGMQSDVEDLKIFGANSTTSNFVATACRDGFCRIHDLRNPSKAVMTSQVPENRGFTSIDFSPDGRWLYAAAARREWQVLDAYTGASVLKVNSGFGHHDVVSCLKVAQDGRVCTGSDDMGICVWNVDRPQFW